MKLYYVYILQCSDDSFYTGITSNLEKRISEHNSGEDPYSYTFKRRPVNVVWVETFTEPNQAIMVEKQLKGWSRIKKKALIEKDWERLKEYSKNKWKRENS